MILQLTASGRGLNARVGSFTLKPRWKERLKDAVGTQRQMCMIGSACSSNYRRLFHSKKQDNLA